MAHKLFKLIKSLSQREITYIKKRMVKGSNYSKVFNEILKMDEVYDEQRLLDKLDVSKNNLRTVKSHLYHRIMDKLYELHSENSIKEKVKKDIYITKILLEKNLQNQIPRRLQRIRDTIENYELFEQLPDLLEVELLMWDKGWYEDSVADIDNLFNRIDKELEKQRILNQYRRYRCIVRKAHLDMNRNINTDFMDGDAFKSEAQATSLRAKIEYYSALATHSFMTGKVEDAYKCNQQLLIIYEENPSLIDIFPKKYILTLSHYLADSLKLKKYAELESGKEKMNQLLEQDTFKKSPDSGVKALEILYRLEFNQVITNKKFIAGLELIKKFKPLFEQYKPGLAPTPKITFCYMVAYLLFANEKYDEALLPWLRYITQQRTDIAEEIYLFALILELIIQYETDHKYVEEQINKVQNRIKRKRPLYKSEEQLFSLLRRLFDVLPNKRIEIFKQYLPVIAELRQDPSEANFYNHFDLYLWILSKIEGKRFCD